MQIRATNASAEKTSAKTRMVFYVGMAAAASLQKRPMRRGPEPAATDVFAPVTRKWVTGAAKKSPWNAIAWRSTHRLGQHVKNELQRNDYAAAGAMVRGAFAVF